MIRIASYIQPLSVKSNQLIKVSLFWKKKGIPTSHGHDDRGGFKFQPHTIFHEQCMWFRLTQWARLYAIENGFALFFVSCFPYHICGVSVIWNFGVFCCLSLSAFWVEERTKNLLEIFKKQPMHVVLDFHDTPSMFSYLTFTT